MGSRWLPCRLTQPPSVNSFLMLNIFVYYSLFRYTRGFNTTGFWWVVWLFWCCRHLHDYFLFLVTLCLFACICSDNAMAMACLRLVTTGPPLPECRVWVLNSCITLVTFGDDFFLDATIGLSTLTWFIGAANLGSTLLLGSSYLNQSTHTSFRWLGQFFCPPLYPPQPFPNWNGQFPLCGMGTKHSNVWVLTAINSQP